MSHYMRVMQDKTRFASNNKELIVPVNDQMMLVTVPRDKAVRSF